LRREITEMSEDISDKKKIDKVVGIDPSLTATGFCVAEKNYNQTGLLSPRTHGVERLIYIYSNILTLCRDAALVTIEGYAHNRQNQAHQMGELGGVLRVALTEAGIKWVSVAPTALKKFATGKGNANKETVAVGVFKGWGREFPNNNEADAFVLAEIGKALLAAEGKWESPGKLTAYQQNVVENIRRGKEG
jgi:crossover junction endodeoxyribonuclease RuvC